MNYCDPLKFADVLGAEYSGLRDACEILANGAIARQLPTLVIPGQVVQGDSESFSVLVIPMPGVDREARMDMPLEEPSTERVCLNGARYEFELDHFGQLSWLRVDGAKGLHARVVEGLAHVKRMGGDRPYWTY